MTDHLDGLFAAEERLLARLRGLDDATARQPSRLPDWTVGHVLTHLARNADSVTRRLEGAADGVVVPQYEGGHEGRAAEIEAGAGRPAAELLADLDAAVVRMTDAIGALPEEAWSRPVGTLGGTTVAARELPFGRWREVEVHHVDLGLGYTPADWPPGLLHDMLPRLLADLRDRTDHAALVAWLLDRGEPPPLSSWGS